MQSRDFPTPLRELPRRKAAACVTSGLKINRRSAIARLNPVMRPLRRPRLGGFTAAIRGRAVPVRARFTIF